MLAVPIAGPALRMQNTLNAEYSTFSCPTVVAPYVTRWQCCRHGAPCVTVTGSSWNWFLHGCASALENANMWAGIGVWCRLWVHSGYARGQLTVRRDTRLYFYTLNAKLNPICHLLALLEAHHILHVSRIRVKHVFYVIEWSRECGCFVEQKKHPDVMRLPRHLQWL